MDEPVRDWSADGRTGHFRMDTAAPLATPGRATPGSVAARLPRAGQRRDLHRIDGGGRPADARATRFPVSRPDSVPPLLHRPHAEVSCPRNALLGHLMGALAGPTSLTMFGLWRHEPALYRMTAGRTCAAALSLGLTAAAMIWAGTPHPPAGATTDGATERRPRSSTRSLNASSGNS
jgi:hypothetical protein